MAAAEEKFKIVLLGEGAAGKSSLVMRFTANKFDERHNSTLQADFTDKRINVAGRRVKLHIWDTAGQERFHALGPIYYRDSHGALLVYDITNSDSFVKVRDWIKELRTMLGQDIVIAIAGNKSDLERQRVVKEEDAEAYAASIGGTHFSTSAKADKGVKEVFLHLTKAMLAARDAGGAPATDIRMNRKRRGPQVDDTYTVDGGGNQPTKGGCCSLI